jgi:hypothetical protein
MGRASQAKSVGVQLPSLTGRLGMLGCCMYQHGGCATPPGREPSLVPEPVRRLLNLIGVSSVHASVDQDVQTARGYRLAVTAG